MRCNHRKLRSCGVQETALPKRVLIVDGDPLARWSLSTYLKRWFTVDATASLDEAMRLLDARDVAAVVVSGALPGNQIDEVEAHARARNPAVKTIRTVANMRATKRPCPSTRQLEKPFRLRDLAQLLGVPAVELEDLGDDPPGDAPAAPPPSE